MDNMDRKSVYGLRPTQLAQLLSLGIEGADSVDQGNEDETIAYLLRTWLKTTFPENKSLLDPLLEIMKRVGSDMREFRHQTLGNVLLDPESDTDLLQAIKDYGKKLSLSVASEAEHALAITVYYAAIASFLVYHKKKITKYSYAQLDASLASLLEKPWMEPELIELFNQARQICQEKEGQPDHQEDRKEKTDQ